LFPLVGTYCTESKLIALDLSSSDTKTSSRIAEAGRYNLKIGASSINIKQTASFNLPKQMVVEKDTK